VSAEVAVSHWKSSDDAVRPAANVWTDPMPESLDEQVEFFKREGFLIIRGVLSADELAEAKSEIARLADNAESLPRVREGFQLEANQDESRTTRAFRKLGGVTAHSEIFATLMRHPKLLPPLHAIIGPRVLLYRDVCMMKPARVGREKPWHQDSVYWPWIPMELVSAMTAIDDASPENGCLQVIPRTHLQQRQHYGDELQIDLTDAEQAQTHYVPLEAGDTLLFHSLLLHASEPNRSEQDRRVCIFSYRHPDLEFIGNKGKGPGEEILVDDQARPGRF
jgi:ectoine hydroxylase-related dioxygenase (phytanoyl-CoA dioxygenase family)